MDTSAGSDYYTTDAIGSILLLTDSTDAVVAHYTYASYGPTSASGTLASTNPFRFAGGYTDPSGLVKFGTRYYSEYSGTFSQQDPAQQGSNLYAYANDDPINITDPTGRCGFSSFGDLGDCFSSATDIAETAFDGVTGCISGLAATDESGVGEYATAVAGPVGGIAANVGGCAIGAGSAIAGGGGVGSDNSGN